MSDEQAKNDQIQIIYYYFCLNIALFFNIVSFCLFIFNVTHHSILHIIFDLSNYRYIYQQKGNIKKRRHSILSNFNNPANINFYQHMFQKVNLEESPFLDVKQKLKFNDQIFGTKKRMEKDGLHYKDNIPWEIIKPRKVYPYQKYDIQNVEDRAKIDQIINCFKGHQTFDFTVLEQNPTLMSMLLEHKELIIKYSQAKYPKAIIAQFLFSFHPTLRLSVKENEMLLKLNFIVNQTQFPLACVILAERFYKLKIGESKVESLFEKAIQYGEDYSFLLYGFFLNVQGNFNKAYQMYKNAELAKYVPIVYIRIGQMFSLNKECSCEISTGRKYILKAKYSNKPLDTKMKLKISLFEQYFDIDQTYIDLLIVSGPEIEAKRVSNHILVKMEEKKLLQKIQYKSVISTSSDISIGQEYICFTPKIFYVVFSPALLTNSRTFLALSENGTIQSISIYNWQEIDINKLKLLHKLGTKVILKEYIRKYGNSDQLPMYRVQKPEWIEIEASQFRHQIPNKKYRQYARILFDCGLYHYCKPIYDFLVMKGEQKEIIYSNLGLLSQKMLNFDEAKDFYRKSINVKRYQKSFYRLAKLQAYEGNIIEAEKLYNQLKENTVESQEIKRLIDSKRQEKIQESCKKVSLSEIVALEFYPGKINSKKHIVEKKSVRIPGMTIEGSALLMGPTLDVFIKIKKEIQEVLQISFKCSQQVFVMTLHQIFYAPQAPFTHENTQSIKQFFQMAYFIIKKYYEQEQFDQSFGYFRHYMRKCFNENLVFSGFQYQVCSILSCRGHYLEERLQNHCINLQRKGQLMEAEKYYRLAGPYCIPFKLKAVQLSFRQGKYSQVIEESQLVFEQLRTQFKSRFIFPYLVKIKQYEIRSLIILKRYQKAQTQAQKMLKTLSKIHPKCLVYRYIPSLKQSFIGQLYNQFINKCIQQVNDYAMLLQIRFHSIYCLQYLNKSSQALQQIKLRQNEITKKGEQRLNFCILIIKIQNLLQLNRRSDKQAIYEVIDQLNQIANSLSDKFYKAAVIKQRFELLMRDGKISAVFDSMTQLSKMEKLHQVQIVDSIIQFTKANEPILFNLIGKLPLNQTVFDRIQQQSIRVSKD